VYSGVLTVALAEQVARVGLDGLGDVGQQGIAGQGRMARQQQALDVNLMPGRRLPMLITRWMSASTCTGFGIMRRSSLKVTVPGTTLVLVPPSIRPTFR
jgi:hypothetical protein